MILTDSDSAFLTMMADYILQSAPLHQADALLDTPFRRLAELLPLKNPNHDMVDMSIGEPQGGMPIFVEDDLHASNPGWSQYPPLRGDAVFLKSVSDWAIRRYKLTDNLLKATDNILPLTGSREGLFLLTLYLCGKKRNALLNKSLHGAPIVGLPNPFYHAYYGGAVMAGADTCCLSANTTDEWVDMVLNLPPDIVRRMACLIICTPDNPTGRQFSKIHLKKLLNHATEHDYVLVSDECYSEIYFTSPPAGLLDVIEKQDDLNHVMIVNSLSKRSGAPGLRSGFLITNPTHIAEIANLRSYGAAISPRPLQQAAAKLWRDEAHVKKNRQHYQDLLKIAENKLKGLKNFQVPDAGFFLWLPCDDGEDLAVRLMREISVKVMPGAYMSRKCPKTGKSPGDGYIRIAMVHEQEKFLRTMDKMAPILLS